MGSIFYTVSETIKIDLNSAVCVCVCSCVSGSQRLTLVVFLNHSPSYLFIDSFPLTPAGLNWLCRSGWPLPHRDQLASVSWGLGWKECATIPSSFRLFRKIFLFFYSNKESVAWMRLQSTLSKLFSWIYSTESLVSYRDLYAPHPLNSTRQAV